MKMQPKFRYFVWFVAALLLTNILVLGDLLTIWSPAETKMFLHLQNPWSWRFHEVLLGGLFQITGFEPLVIRFGSVAAFLLALGGIFSLGRRLFSDRTLMLSLLVLASNLLMPNLAKVATGDLWLFAFLSVGSLSMILYLKKPSAQWRNLSWLTTGLAIWTDPLSGILWSQTLWIGLYFLHPEGKRLSKLFLWAFIPLIGLQYVFGWGETFVIRWNGRDFLYQLLAILPWIGLLAGGFSDLVFKIRKKEELSILLLCLLVAGIVSGTVMMQFAFALIIAKQLDLYMLRNYPHRNIVKTIAILHLIAVFLAAFLGMMWGFGVLGGTGFRAGMAMGGFYWIASFVAVIGLYSPNHRMIMTGMTLAGLLFTTMTWLQLGPIVEGYRSLPKRALQLAGAGPENELIIQVEDEALRELLMVYNNGTTGSVKYTSDTLSSSSVWLVDENGLSGLIEKIQAPTIDSVRVEGWSLPGSHQTIWVVKP